MLPSTFLILDRPKMYKTRLKQWGYTRYCTADEVAKFLRQRRQREAAGEKSGSQAGDEAEFKRVQRYIKRKTAHLESMEEIRLKCRRQSSPLPSLKRPKVFEDSEIIFTCIRDYVNGSFDNGTWALTNEGFGIRMQKEATEEPASLRLGRYLTSAELMLKQSRVCQAGQILLQAFSNIEQCLQEEDVFTLPHLFDHLLKLLHRWPDIANSLLRQFVNIAMILLPRMHPLCQILKRLAWLEPANMEFTILTAWKGTLDHLESITGSMNADLLGMWGSLFVQSRSHRSESFSQLSQGFCEKLDELHRFCEVKYSKIDKRTFEVVRIFMYFLYFIRDADEEVETLATDLCERVDLFQSQDQPAREMETIHREQNKATALRYKAIALRYKAFIQCIDGRNELAVSSLRQAIKILALVYGWRGPEVLGWLILLEQWLTRWDYLSSAAELRHEIMEILDAIESDIELPVPEQWRISDLTVSQRREISKV